MGREVRRNAGAVGLATLASRVLGLVREMLHSRLIGAGWEQSAFVYAFMIPNLARRLFGEGALTSAFVPLFRTELEHGGFEKARRLARAVLTALTLCLAAVVLLAMSACGCVLLRADALSERTVLLVRLVRLLLPYMVFICAGAFGMGVLNALGSFALPALVPCVLNVCWIGTLAVLWFLPGLSVEARLLRVSVAVLVSGFLQMAILLLAMRRRGVSPAPTFEGWRDESTRLVWKRLVSAAVGSGAQQINTVVSQTLAIVAAPWAAAAIGYADRLMELPLALVGVSFGTVLLPTFSASFSKGDTDGAREAFVSSVRDMLFLLVPAAVGLMMLAPDVIRAFYQGRAFDAEATVRVSRALAAYAAGLVFFGFQKALVPWFQAQGDVRTPRDVAVWTMLLNMALNVAAVRLLPVAWRHVGIAGALGLSAAVACVRLSVLATRKNESIGLRRLVAPLGRSVMGAVGMAMFLWWVDARGTTVEGVLGAGLTDFLPAGLLAPLSSLLDLGLRVVGAAAVYFALTFVLRRGKSDE